MFFNSAERLLKKGKYYLEKKDVDKALKYFSKAEKKGNGRVIFEVSRTVITALSDAEGTLAEEKRQHYMNIMFRYGFSGYRPAREFLDEYSASKYRSELSAELDSDYSGPLVDFNGVPIEVNHRGALTPIDAVLEHKDGQNIFTLSLNAVLWCDREFPNEYLFMESVLKGIRAWEGDYRVFGGQKVTVRVDVTTNDQDSDNVYIIPLTKRDKDLSKAEALLSDDKEGNKYILRLLNGNRSFFLSGEEWSVTSGKNIYILSKDEMFGDCEEIMHVVKHEFGHALGLGDLYAEAAASLDGVAKGSYKELDSYYISGKYYNQVMCDHHAPVSNNDIEMVILAFRTNSNQLFQTKNGKGTVSEALGKGN